MKLYKVETDEQLKKFVQGVTGLVALPRETVIIIVPRAAAEPSSLPSFHTCGFCIDMPRYPDYETFKQKLEMSLDYIDGFQLI